MTHIDPVRQRRLRRLYENVRQAALLATPNEARKLAELTAAVGDGDMSLRDAEQTISGWRYHQQQRAA